MIVCSVCQHPNHHLKTTCASCGAFIQAKVDNLDLFQTSWNVIERPLRAFHTIAVARHKNYVLMLAALAGVALAFAGLWLGKAGEVIPNLFLIIAAGSFGGLGLGVAAILLFALLVTLVARSLRHTVRYWNAVAVAAYATVPLALSAILVLPVEILTFGRYLFTREPSAFMLKPVSFIALSALDGLFGLWTVALVVVGVRTLLDVGWGRALIVAAVSLGILGAGVALGTSLLASAYAPRGV